MAMAPFAAMTMTPGLADACAVGIGAVFGALARHHIGKAAAERIAANPDKLKKLTGWHTAGINVAGSFVLGAVAGLELPAVSPPASTSLPTTTSGEAQAKPLPKGTIARSAAAVAAKSSSSTSSSLSIFALTPRVKFLLGVGFCGSFTTFSTYSVDVVNMIQGGHAFRALSYVAANNLGGFAAAAAGMVLVRKAFRIR